VIPVRAVKFSHDNILIEGIYVLNISMNTPDPDAFLNQFITSDDELIKRMACCCDFGAPMATTKHDVPIYDQYNRGLALCQDSRPRTNLALEGNRPGVTGSIPSMEEAHLYPGTLPMGQKLLVNLNPTPVLR
jgi:hypothetical protein